MPDADVGNDPEFIRASAELALWSERLEKLEKCGARRYLPLTEPIQSELNQAREDYRWACLDCFLAGDNSFVGIHVQAERIQLLEQTLDAAQTVRNALDRGVYLVEELEDRVRNAKQRLSDVRLHLKRQAVLAQRQFAAA
jgi:hypothetical protein